MRIYFSGNYGNDCLPEIVIAERRPHIMLTFYEYRTGVKRKQITMRLKAHLKQLKREQE